MMRRLVLTPALFLMLAACAGNEPVQSTRTGIQGAPGGLSYNEYRAHVRSQAQSGHGWSQDVLSKNYSDSTGDIQKRFLALDRDNNGRLSPAELSGH